MTNPTVSPNEAARIANARAFKFKRKEGEEMPASHYQFNAGIETAIKAMGASDPQGAPVKTDDFATRKDANLEAPATNELIAKMEALRSGRTYAEWNKAINKCCDIVRAHKPAFVDLDKATDAVYQAAYQRANFSDGKVNDTREFSRLLAKAVIQALGMDCE